MHNRNIITSYKLSRYSGKNLCLRTHAQINLHLPITLCWDILFYLTEIRIQLFPHTCNKEIILCVSEIIAVRSFLH